MIVYLLPQFHGWTNVETDSFFQIERIYDIAMGVVLAIQHLDRSYHETSTSPEGQLLHEFFDLMNKLRGGNHPFQAALTKALETLT